MASIEIVLGSRFRGKDESVDNQKTLAPVVCGLDFRLAAG